MKLMTYVNPEYFVLKFKNFLIFEQILSLSLITEPFNIVSGIISIYISLIAMRQKIFSSYLLAICISSVNYLLISFVLFFHWGVCPLYRFEAFSLYWRY